MQRCGLLRKSIPSNRRTDYIHHGSLLAYTNGTLVEARQPQTLATDFRLVYGSTKFYAQEYSADVGTASLRRKHGRRSGVFELTGMFAFK